MTTTIVVQAHCSPDKEVAVAITGNGVMLQSRTLQDGEEAVFTIHGAQQISVLEGNKPAAMQAFNYDYPTKS